MSHIVSVKVQMKNKEALDKAIEHLGLQNLGQGTHQVYGRKALGVGMKLPNWQYPVVVNLETGEAVYDNFNGSWGKQQELDKLVQRYSIEVASEQAIANGYMLTENPQENGDIEVVMERLVAT